MTNIPSLFSQKQLKLSSYGETINLANKENLTTIPNKLLIFTAFGIVSGTYQAPKEFKKDESPKEIFEVVSYTYKQVLENSYEAEPNAKTNFCRSIVLKDVTITTSSNIKFNMPFIELFDDQIIGVTLGNLPE